MILDWFCNQCGTQGTAVAKRGEEAYRVQISHRYAGRNKRGLLNRCKGQSVRYVERHRKAQSVTK